MNNNGLYMVLEHKNAEFDAADFFFKNGRGLDDEVADLESMNGSEEISPSLDELMAKACITNPDVTVDEALRAGSPRLTKAQQAMYDEGCKRIVEIAFAKVKAFLEEPDIRCRLLTARI